MKKKKLTKAEKIAHEEKYVEFLRIRLASENFQQNVSEEEYLKTKEKYERAKFRLKMMKM